MAEVGGVAIIQNDLALGPNTAHVIQQPLVVLRFVGELRREQVWNKVIQPHPDVQILGLGETSDEIHAMLTDYGSAQVINKGVKGEVVRLSDKASQGGTRAHFDSLVILEKADVKRKRKMPNDGSGAAAGGMGVGGGGAVDDGGLDKPKQLVFSLYRRRPGNYLTTIHVQHPIHVKNSFHTLSADEKNYRRNAYEELKSKHNKGADTRKEE